MTPAFERGPHGLGLAPIRHRQNDQRAFHDLRHRHGDRLVGHVRECRKPAFAELLLAATLFERHDLEGLGRVEIRRRIVEREMRVLADPSKHDVDRVRRDQGIDAGSSASRSGASPSMKLKRPSAGSCEVNRCLR